jgi:hypothetical protein
MGIYSTHYQPQVIRFAMEHNCIMLCLPPHTTHESQPLDVGVFAPLKVQWSRCCHDFYQRNPGRIVTKFNFCGLFSKAWYQAVTPSNIIAGFHKAGVYPYNPCAVAITEQAGLSSSSDSANKGPSSGVVEGPSTTPTPGPSNSATSFSPNLSSVAPSVAPGPSNKEAMLRPGPSFTLEQSRRYQTRYEEGYDVGGDVDYINWLKLNHPETVPVNETVAGNDSLRQTALAETNDADGSSDVSLAQHFSYVSPLSAVASNILSPLSSPDSPASVSRSASDHSTGNVISKYLVGPSSSTPASRKTPLPRARLLTSAAALQILEEKEPKKPRRSTIKRTKEKGERRDEEKAGR